MSADADASRLVRAEGDLAALLMAAVDAIIIIDDGGRIETFNPAAEKLFGYPAAELVGRDVSVLMPAGHSERHSRYLDDYTRTGQRRIIGIGRDVTAQRADGSRFPVFLSVGEIRGGERRRFVGILHDMTARHAALAAAEAERDRAERYFDIAGALLVVLGPDYRIQLVNRRGLDILGYPADELRGEDYFDRLVPAAFAGERRTEFARLCATAGAVLSAEGPVLRKDGTLRILSLRARVITDAEGVPSGYLISGEDITERRHAEQELRKSESLLRAAQEIANLGNFEVAPGSGNVRWSDQACRMVGFAGPGAPASIDDFRRTYVHPDDQERFAAAWSAALNAGARFELTYRIVRPDGVVRDLQGIAQPLGPDQGGPTVLGTLHDMTERRQAEDELRQSHDKLTHFGRLSTMGEMASGLAHEINQPLTAIATYAQASMRLLDSGSADPADLREALAAIAQQSLRAGEVIRRLRALVKNRETRAEPLDINKLVQEVRVLAETDARVNDLRLVLDLCAGSMPVVIADPVQIQQVLLNLVRNAIDATLDRPQAPREVRIQTRLVGESEVEVAVIDHGTGIEASVEPHLFNAFYTTKPSGTGLGLAISKSIIRAHQGRLAHRPSEGSGTTFYFTLPCNIGA
jgi:two-component system, LuxR family, sensor kinase FixL